MHLERRRVLRRAVAGGVVLAVFAAIPLGMMEALYVYLVQAPAFSSVKESFQFGLYLFLLLVSVAAILGAVEGVVVLGVHLLTQKLAKQRLKEPPWMAWLYSLVCLPVIAVMASMLFSGRRAQEIAGRHFIALGVGIVALLATYVVFRLIIGARDRFRIRRWGPRQAALLAALMLSVAVGLYLVDQRILVRLYPWFHVGLSVLTVACCQMAAGAIYAAYRPTARWMGRLAEPGVALLIFIAGIGGAAWTLNRVSRWESLRFVYYEHTAVHAELLTLANRIGLGTSAPPPDEAVPQEETPQEDTLLAGPKLRDANVLLLSVDALRADHLGAYGYPRKTSPNIDRWARRAAIFERGYCQVPHTSFSVTSLMTGSYLYSAMRVDPGRRHRTVADVLRRYGFKTAAFFPPAVFYIDREKFTAFESSRYGFEYVKLQYSDASKRVDQILEFLRQHEQEGRRAPGSKQRRFFIWAHFFEPHEPYVRHTGIDFGSRAVDRYDGEIAYVDRQIGRLLKRLRSSHPNTIIALTGDHGEEFGEHGGHYHGNALYEQQVRVPLIISVPGAKGRRVRGAAQVIDLPVSILSLVDVPTSAGMRGTDLGPWIAGEAASRLPPAFCEMEQKKMVVRGGHKLICDTARGFCELYDLRRDPGEQVNLTSRKPALARRLKRSLHGWMASHAQRNTGDDLSRSDVVLDRGRQRDTSVIPELAKLAAERGDLAVRRRAIQWLSAMQHPAARAPLVRAADDPDPGVRIQAVVGAARLGHAASLKRITKLLARRDLPLGLRRDALLAQAGAGDRTATAPLSRVLDASTEVYDRHEIIIALGKLGDPAAGPALRRQLKTLRTRLYSMEALGLVKDRQAVPLLLASLKSDRFISWRRAAARALGNIGDPRARQPLAAAVRQDLEPDVVADALIALARIRALPPAGPRSLVRGPWTCTARHCTLSLAVQCTAGVPLELLLALKVGPLRSLKSAHQGGEKAVKPGAQWEVRCGDRVVAKVDSSRDAAVVQLPAGLSGPLSLRVAVPAAAAPQPAPLLYTGLRSIPPERRTEGAE